MARSSSPTPTRPRTSIAAPASARARSAQLAAPAEALPLFASLFEALAFVLLCGVLAVAPTQLSGFWPVSRDYWPQSVALLAALVASLLLALSGSRSTRETNISPLSLCLLGFAACNVLSLATASYKHDALLEMSRLIAALAWFPIARRLLFARPEQASGQVLAPENLARRERKLLCAVMASISVGALWACGTAFLGFRAGGGRQAADFYNANLLAFGLAMSLPLCAGAWFLARSLTRPRVADAIGLAALMAIAVGLLLSFSKGGLLAGALGMLAFVLMIWSARRQAAASTWKAHRRVLLPLVLLGSLALGIVGAKTVAPRLQSAAGSESHSTIFRLYTWRGTLAMANARPLLGHGPGSFPTSFPRFEQAGYTRSAHQSWLQIAAESGWPSLLFLLGAIGCGLARARKYLRDKDRPHRAWVGAGAGAALVATLVHGSTDSGWSILSIALLLCVSLALLDAPEAALAQAAQGEVERRPLALGWLGALVPLALAASYGVKAQGAENARRSGRELAAMSEAERAQAGRQAEQATRDVPLDARAWTNLAQFRLAQGDKLGASLDYGQAAKLQPDKALHPRRLAEIFESWKRPDMAAKYLDEAISLDPKDTSLRLQRARLREQSGDTKGAREDYQSILDLQDAPFGRYPATPEIVNGDFNRARLALARQAQRSGDSATARKLAELGLRQIKEARTSARVNKLMIEAVQMYGEGLQSPSEAELSELESAFKSLL